MKKTICKLDKTGKTDCKPENCEKKAMKTVPIPLCKHRSPLRWICDYCKKEYKSGKGFEIKKEIARTKEGIEVLVELHKCGECSK